VHKRRLFGRAAADARAQRVMNISFEPLAEDDPLRSPVERAERALRESVARSLEARGEILLGSSIDGCACSTGADLRGSRDDQNYARMLASHNATYEHLLASIYHTLYIQTWPIPGEKIAAALRPRARVLGEDVLEAIEALLDSEEDSALALAFRLVAQTAVLKGGFR